MTFHTILVTFLPHTFIYRRVEIILTYPSYLLNATAEPALY